jgi:nitroreductase
MELSEVLRNRRSTRKFTGTVISHKLLDKIIEAGLYAPKASNRQHWEIIVVDDPATIKSLYSVAGAQEIVLNAPAVLVVVVNQQFNTNNFSNIQSTAAAVENMLLQATELGIGTCYMTGIGDTERIREILGIPRDMLPVCFVLVGLPAEKPNAPPRKDVAEVVHTNKYRCKNITLPKVIRSSELTVEQISEHQRFLSRAYGLGADYEFYSTEEVRAIEDVLSRNVQPNSKIVNLIGYDGTLLRQLAKRYPEITDLELNKDALEFVRYKAENLNYSTISEYDQDASADFVLALFSLEKLPRDFLLRQAKRLLRRNGRLIIVFKNKISLYGLIYFIIERLMGARTIEGFFVRSGPFEPLAKPSIIKSAGCLGLRVVKSGGLFLIPPEIKLFAKKIDGYLKRHGKKLSILKYLLKPSINILGIFDKYVNKIKLPVFYSSGYMVLENYGET